MSAAQNLPPADRTRDILEDLEAVRENLLALSDDIWAGIDRQDLAAFDEGVRRTLALLTRPEMLAMPTS